MGCGCGGGRDPTLPEKAAERTACVLARCRCATEGFTTCCRDGRRLDPKVLGADACPLGNFPEFREDGAPVCRWLGIRWYGVPAPFRWGYQLRRWLRRTWAAVVRRREPAGLELPPIV